MTLAGRGLPTVAASAASVWRRLAEGEGFEPPVPFRVQWFSRPPPSTTRPSLRVEARVHHPCFGGQAGSPPYRNTCFGVARQGAGRRGGWVEILAEPSLASRKRVEQALD